MPEYGANGTRTVRANKHYRCDNCNDIIFKRSRYENHREDPRGGRTWQGRRHLDCEAPWWQVDPTNLLKALGALPSSLPSKKFDLSLVGSHFIVKTDKSSPSVRVDWSLPHELRKAIANTPKKRGDLVLDEIATALELFLTTLTYVSGNKKASLQVSHLLQQAYQIAQNVKHQTAT